MAIYRRLLSLIMLIGLLGLTFAPRKAVQPISAAYSAAPSAQAEALLAQMAVEEKVGQLFLVGFYGTDLTDNAQITRLIRDYHLGGVTLSLANNNFGPGGDALATYQTFVGDLQAIAWDAANREEADGSATYLPLLIGIQQPGNGSGSDQIITGITQLPNQMTIGATWNPHYAYQVGERLGKELSALGFNLLLGPSLDVINSVEQWQAANSFGGDPKWVAVMGQEYIRGVKTGSQGDMLVVARHFPGAGRADRAPDSEVATVLKPIDSLHRTELLPFFAVTGEADSDLPQADGVLVSHIRYEALQGTIRTTTKPVSLDPNALQKLLQEPSLATWEAQGGLVVSDNLASQAVRLFFDPSNQSFDARQVFLSALTAGNHLLMVDGLVNPEDEAGYLALIDVMGFFADKYREDPVFAALVDDAVLKVLNKKLTIYDQFDLSTVNPLPEDLAVFAENKDFLFTIARDSVTLVSPGAESLEVLLPNPPGLRERMVFITDVSSARQCTRCETVTDFSDRNLMNVILTLYGPQASGQISATHLSYFSYADLKNYLDDTLREQEHPVYTELLLAEWVVFAQLEDSQDRANAAALKQLLAERPDLLNDKQVVVFSFGAPSLFDATEISKFTAYYALYSKGQNFIDVAARILFQDISTGGALPASMPAVGYEVLEATLPDPNQVIPLMVDDVFLAEMIAEGELDVEIPGLDNPELTPVPELTVTPMLPVEFRVGDDIPLLAGPIVDYNGHQVADGTRVQFQIANLSDATQLTQVMDTVTDDGMARVRLPIRSAGFIEIRVISLPAERSSVLQIDVPDEGVATIVEINPEPAEETPTPTPTPTLSPTPTLTPTLSPTSEPDPAPVIFTPRAEDWIVGVVIAWSSGILTFFITKRKHTLRWQGRRGLLVIIASLLAYVYLVLRLPGSDWLLLEFGTTWSAFFITIIGALAGLLIGWVWHHEFE